MALLALHFILVVLPTKLRTIHESKTDVSQPTSTITTSTALTTAIDAKADPLVLSNDGDSLAAGIGVCADPGRHVSVAAGVSRTVGGVSGVGKRDDGDRKDGKSAQLGGKPSHVFKVVLPSDPAFDVEVKCF